jgi:putative endopeptidase
MNGCAILALLLLTAAQADTPRTPASGLDLAAFDRSVRPQDDLFRFANGAWLASTPVSPERVTSGAFFELADKVESDLRAIIEAIPTGSPPGSPARQIRDLYDSIVDEARVEALGAAPLRSQLQAIDGARSLGDLAAAAGALSAAAEGGPFAASPSADPRDPRLVVVRITQGGILLPDRNYYLQHEPRLVEIRKAYAAYLARIFRAIDRAKPEADAQAVIAVETAIARAHVPPGEATEVAAARVALRQLPAEMPGFDWMAWAKPQGLDRAHALILEQPGFFKSFAAIVPTLPLESWKAWLAARHVTAMAPYLSRAFADARFEFFGRVLSGQEAPRARWKRGVSLVNGYLGDELGRLYVDTHFSAESRQRVERLAANVVSACRRALAASPWMSAATRREALEKLSRLSVKVAYPDRWRTYGALEIRADDLLGNVRRAQKFQNDERLSRIVQPGERGYWQLTPQAVNTYYSIAANEIVLPAAMLQPPLFTAGADDAVNYGAIGAVIGHELSHAFDERGRRTDAQGEASDWWTPEDDRAFRERARILIAHYDGFTPLPGARVNGTLTFGENLGDVAGLAIAHRAYRLSLNGRAAPVIDGFTGDQRFYLGWAQVWRAAVREEYLRQWVLWNVYAPPEFRVNGPVSHVDSFYEAFAVKPGDGLFLEPGKRGAIW